MIERVLQQAEACFKAGDRARAEALCHEALGHAPGNADALRLLGVLRLEGGRAADAIPLLREALQADPENLSALDALSAALTAVGDHPQAEEIVRRALALDASLVVAHMRLGMTLSAQGKWREAARVFEGVIERDPQIADAHHNLGDALTKLHRPEEAIDCFRRALAINPENPETHNSLGLALQELRLRGAAAGRFQRALALDPAFAKAHYNLALASLFHQDFEQGWPEYEHRLQCEPTRATLRKRADTLDRYERLPRWRGPSETGIGEVAIWTEQGIGDQILYSTLIPELIGTGVPLVYEVDSRLLPAYRRSFPVARFVAWEEPPREALQRADRVLLAGSLPGLFRRTREAFARQPAKLLGALPERLAHYRRRLDALGPGLKVALSWRSLRQDWWVEKKNARLSEFVPLLKLPGVTFVDVQYGDTADERGALEAATDVRLARFDDVDFFNDLEEVLAILEACDLVITISNATAHFAGALGKRTWLLYLADQAPFHYWAHGGNYRALWYPSVEILSAARLADWPSLLRSAAEKLEREIAPADRRSAGTAGGGSSEVPAPHGALEHARQLRLEGKLTESIEACRRTIGQAPGDAAAWSELAHALRWQDQLDEARRAAARAIELEPGLASAWFNLGAVQAAQGDAARGIESYRKALEFKPDMAEAWSNLGDALGTAGDKPGEIAAYRRAIEINPQLAPVWSNLGTALLEAEQFGAALASCRRATELDPDFAAGWNNLGNALHQCGEHEEAVKACESALRLSPGLAEAWSSLGAALHSLGRHDDAVRAHQNAIGIAPGVAHHHFNLGMALQHGGRGEEAIAPLRRAILIDPEHAQAHWDLSFALLGAGRLPEGWDECEWRWRSRGAEKKRHDFTEWDGDAGRPRRLLLWAEQGIGDQILYASMIPGLAATPLDITLEIDPRLAPLFQRSFPGVSVAPRQDPPAARPAGHDCQAPLASLGRWLRPSFSAFPRHNGYLKADAAQVEAFSARLRRLGPEKVIGISWHSVNREFGAHKSSKLPDWAGLLRAPGVRFVDLQYGDTAGAREALRQRYGLDIMRLDGVDLYHDLEALAALCAACDLVITVSNVTAHMAGALGRPVWLLAPKGNGKLWYWFPGRDDSPWYPSMRIFTQQTPGNWSHALDAAESELAAFAKNR